MHSTRAGQATIYASWQDYDNPQGTPCQSYLTETDEEHISEGKETSENQATNIAPQFDFAEPQCENCTNNMVFPVLSVILTVKPKVTINVPATAKDGDTVTFSVTTQGGTPTAYQWSFEAPSGAGNNPQVNFTAPTNANTQAKAHWFANPNSDCATSPPQLDTNHPYYNSKYKIKVKVTFQGGREITKDSNFTVNAFWDPAGTVAPATNSGGPLTKYDSTRQLYVVVNSGTMVRNTYSAIIYIPIVSQFYNKILNHEKKHELQWQSGLFKDVRAVSSFMAAISGLTDTTAAGLTQKINQAFLAWDAQQFQNYKNNFNAAEIEAFTISDPLAPLFAYQRCGRTTFP